MHGSMSSGTHNKNSLWEATSAPSCKLNSLEGEHKADVVVIGAGISGLSTALHLAQAGCCVAVIEAGEPGSGATGKSGGLIAPDFINHSPAEIKQVLGHAAGERLCKMVGSSARQCFDLIESHNISCDAKRDGFWVPGHDNAVLTSLRNRAEEWQNAGFDVQSISADETAHSLGASRYCGAIRFSDGGSLNPLAFSRGLAEAAIRQGATIYSNSRVNKLVRRPDGWRVITPSGQLDAKRVVLAANGGNAALHVRMKRTVLPLSVFEFATAPLSAAQRASILPEGGAFTDKQPYLFTGRYDSEARLISAFPDFSINRRQKCLYGEAKRRLVQYFPVLETVSIDYLWHGTAWINPSLLPKIYGLEEGVFAIQACNGRGLAINAVLGKEMASALIHENESLLSVKPEPPISIRAHRIAQMAPSILMAKAYLKDRVCN
jgi:glycine/D-amino acid oxidase-like deaminating enzyme